MIKPAQNKYDPSTNPSGELQIITEALNELAAARKRYPQWPIDIVHATAIMVEEATETMKSANEVLWSHKSTSAADVRHEAIQTIAMCLRLLTETPELIGATYPEVRKIIQ